MFCPECGKQVSDNAVACPQCGHSFAGATSAQATQFPMAAAAQPQVKKKILPKILIGVGVVLGALLLLGVLAGNKSESDSSSGGNNSSLAEMQQQANAHGTDTFYWSGSKYYHLDPSCSYLASASDVHSGSAEEALNAGAHKACKECVLGSSSGHADNGDDSQSEQQSAQETEPQETQEAQNLEEALRLEGTSESDLKSVFDKWQEAEDAELIMLFVQSTELKVSGNEIVYTVRLNIPLNGDARSVGSFIMNAVFASHNGQTLSDSLSKSTEFNVVATLRVLDVNGGEVSNNKM